MKAYTDEEWKKLTKEEKQDFYEERRPMIQSLLDRVNQTSKDKQYFINKSNVLFYKIAGISYIQKWRDFLIEHWDFLKTTEHAERFMSYLLGSKP